MQLVEFVNNTGDSLEQGDVVVIGESQDSLAGTRPYLLTPEVDLTEQSYDTRVCGVVSEVRVELRDDAAQAGTETGEAQEDAPAEKPRRGAKAARKGSEPPRPTPQPRFASQEELDQLDRSRVESGQIGLMVTQGVCAYCKVDADIEPVKVGDLLTTSTTKGHAQKVTDATQATGAIVGKALSSLPKGKGKIPVVITLQ